MKASITIVFLGSLFALPASAQQCNRLRFMEVDSNRVYSGGQKVRYGEAHGVYTGFLPANTLYFMCPGKLTVSKRGSLAPGETFEEGSANVFIRRATDHQWTKKIFDYKCEDLALIPGKMEYAVSNGSEIQVGSHNALCTFSERK